MNHDKIVKLKRDHHELAKELRRLRSLERNLEEGMANVKAIGDKARLEEQLIRTRSNIGSCMRRQEELSEQAKTAWE